MERGASAPAPNSPASPPGDAPFIGTNALNGATVSDDNRPHTSSLTTEWTQVGGPAVAPITFINALSITANLTLPGAYTFRLTAFDGELCN